jgi:hypothetical protein
LITQGLTQAVKMSVNRTRPDGAELIPSGHTSTTFASATVLQRRFGWKAGLPAYGFATYVAASRVQVKRHFLSDVAFGAALGIVVGRSVTIGRGDARFVEPMAAPGGAGVQLRSSTRGRIRVCVSRSSSSPLCWRRGAAQCRPPVARLGPQVGDVVPSFSLVDQSGRTHTLKSILGPRGAIVVFFRSADW